MLRISNQGIILAFALIVLPLGANSAIMYRNTVRLHEEAASVEATYGTIDSITESLSALGDADSGRRSFIITGDERYLDTYREGTAVLAKSLERLRQLIRENQGQQARLADFEALIGKKLEELALTIDARRKESGFDLAREQALIESSKRAMEAIRARGHEMVAEEQLLLTERSKSADETFDTAIRSGLASAGASIALGVFALYLILRNIQARTRATRELEEQHDLLQTTLASIAEGIVVTDAGEHVTYMNRVAQVMTGQDQATALGRPLAEVVLTRVEASPGDPQSLIAGDSAVQTSSPRQILISSDGTQRDIDERAAPLVDRLDQRIGTVRALRDVTAMRANLRLIESLLLREKQNAQRLRQIAAAASTLNSAHSREKVLHLLREEARTILGFKDAVVVLGPHATPDSGAVLSVPLYGREGQTVGKVELVDPERADANQDESAMAILQQLSHIASVAMENARLYEELREGDRRKDEFLATLAHELRNPLAPVRNSVQIMRSSNADAADRERALSSIERQVSLLVRLVDDLLDVSRITRGKVALKLQQVELSNIVAQALDISRTIVEASGNQLAVELPSTPVQIEADPVRLAQVVSNLLGNAAKYTDRGGHILLACEVSEAEVVIRVRDDGIGIPKDMLPRIFDMFWQVDHALERAQGGLGIGLTLVRQLVELHGGRVEAHSAGPGTGSEFTIRLPRSRSAGRAGATAPPRAQLQDERKAQPQQIVVVDDNVDSAESLALLLSLQGHTVGTAHDGIAAVELILQRKPALVLLDIGLPRMNGYDVARAIRAQFGSKIMLVAMTGWGQAEDRRRSKEAGFDHHLAKPIDQAQLQKILVDLGLNHTQSNAP